MLIVNWQEENFYIHGDFFDSLEEVKDCLRARAKQGHRFRSIIVKSDQSLVDWSDAVWTSLKCDYGKKIELK